VFLDTIYNITSESRKIAEIQYIIMTAEANQSMQREWSHLPVAGPPPVQAHPQQYYEIATNDIGNDMYVQIMEACQPFYQSSEKYDSATFKIPPRLEDGLGITSQTSGEGNPQDGAS
jgi:hypothetical protein